MSMFNLPSTKTDVSKRSEAGCKSIYFPTGLDNETKVLYSGCSSCSKINDHSVCVHIGFQPDHNESRYEDVLDENRILVEDINRVQTGLFYLGYVTNGYIGSEILYNARGGGDNATQLLGPYVVQNASNKTLTVQGPNPKFLTVGELRENPLFPLPDPLTGETSRLISDSRIIRLPTGASAEFDYNSCLSNKCKPLIVSIDYPETDDLENVTFTVELDQTVDNAMEPRDKGYVPQNYFVSFRAEVLYPSDWRNYQKPRESAFIRRTDIQFNTASVHRLKDTQGNDTRVLYPSYFIGCMTATIHKQDTTTEFININDLKALLTTTQVAEGSWTTDLDLTGYDFTTEVDYISVDYYCEATASDPLDGRVWHQASCSNSQTDPTGSAVHSNGEHCTNTSCSQFDKYQAGCFLPDADKFSMGDETNGFGSKEFPPRDLGDSRFLSQLYTRGDWYIQQEVPGMSSHRAFQLVKPSGGGPSIYSLLGSWRDDVTGAYIQRTEPVSPPAYGERLTYTDNEDNEHQEIIKGAVHKRYYDFDIGGPSDYHDALGNPTSGLLPSTVSGWTTKNNSINSSFNEDIKAFPYRDIGSTNVYKYQNNKGGMHISSELVSNMENIVVNVDPSVEDTSVSTAIRSRFQ